MQDDEMKKVMEERRREKEEEKRARFELSELSCFWPRFAFSLLANFCL